MLDVYVDPQSTSISNKYPGFYILHTSIVISKNKMLGEFPFSYVYRKFIHEKIMTQPRDDNFLRRSKGYTHSHTHTHMYGWLLAVILIYKLMMVIIYQNDLAFVRSFGKKWRKIVIMIRKMIRLRHWKRSFWLFPTYTLNAANIIRKYKLLRAFCLIFI